MSQEKKAGSSMILFAFLALAAVALVATALVASPGSKAGAADAKAKADPQRTVGADSGPWAVKETAEELRQRLTPEQYHVTQEEGTERPFSNEYWDNKVPGIYVDVVSGEPLFSSTHKFKSGTGWPSFYQPLEPDYVVEKRDLGFGMARTEVRSKNGDSHLGHLFNDGPKPTGLRYCINSASLRFIPKDDLEKEGYGKYLGLFAGDASAKH